MTAIQAKCASEVTTIESVQQRAKQLRLFSLSDPLTDRFGSDYFRSLPQEPGVYFFHGTQGELLYIGQSSDLKARIGSYRHVTPEKNPRRTLRLVHRVAKIEFQTCMTANEAVELERILLLEHRPSFNRAGVWQGDPWWLNVVVSEGIVHLDLTRREGGIGPLSSAFRYALGSLTRCLYRASFPSLSISQYPHGLFGPAVPLTLTLLFPDVDDAVEMIMSFVEGDSAELLTRLESLSLGNSKSEQEYWLGEVERLKKYAARRTSVRLNEGIRVDFLVPHWKQSSLSL